MPDALDESNPAYAGVAASNAKTHAYDQDAPLAQAEGEDRVADEVRQAEEDNVRTQPIPTQAWLGQSDQTTPQPWND